MAHGSWAVFKRKYGRHFVKWALAGALGFALGWMVAWGLGVFDPAPKVQVADLGSLDKFESPIVQAIGCGEDISWCCPADSVRYPADSFDDALDGRPWNQRDDGYFCFSDGRYIPAIYRTDFAQERKFDYYWAIWWNSPEKVSVLVSQNQGD